MSEKYLYKFFWDCGRSGEVEGLFVATDEEVAKLNGAYVYFGEILGKHSEVYGNIEGSDVEKLDIDAESVAKVSTLLGETWSGYNPFHYIRYDCEICGDSFPACEMRSNNTICDCCEREGE